MKRHITLGPRPAYSKNSRNGDSFPPFRNLIEDTLSSLSLSSPKPKENSSSKGQKVGRRSARFSKLRLKSDSPRNQPKLSFAKCSEISGSLSDISNQSTQVPAVKSESAKARTSAIIGLTTNVKSNSKNEDNEQGKRELVEEELNLDVESSEEKSAVEISNKEQKRNGEQKEEEQPNNDKANNSKKVYTRISAKKKLDLALFCRDFEMQHGKIPKRKDVEIEFP